MKNIHIRTNQITMHRVNCNNLFQRQSRREQRLHPPTEFQILTIRLEKQSLVASIVQCRVISLQERPQVFKLSAAIKLFLISVSNDKLLITEATFGFFCFANLLVYTVQTGSDSFRSYPTDFFACTSSRTYMHASDRQTERQTELSLQDRSLQQHSCGK